MGKKIKILAICFPTFGKENNLHYLKNNKYIFLSPAKFLELLIKRGHEVDIVQITGKKVTEPLYGPNILTKEPEEVLGNKYDVIWHMFRDPTQPEVIEIMDTLTFDNDLKIINDIKYLRNHNKHHYYPILNKYGIGPRILELSENQILKENFINTSWGSISSDKTKIKTRAYNNNLNDYIERKDTERIFAKYVDNASGGVRSFFRIGYMLEEFSQGYLYCDTDDILLQKNGTKNHKVPFRLPKDIELKIRPAMKEMKVDACHLEGILFKDRKVIIFDINAHPTAGGQTLDYISEGMVDSFINKFAK